MPFSQHLVLWLHVTFVVFTIGPVTLAIMSTPRYIRHRDVKIVRYLSRITFVFTLASLGVLIAGMFLAQMMSKAGKPWVIISATLFLVAILLLVLIVRDQRKALKALEQAAAQSSIGGAAGLTDETTAADATSQAAAQPASQAAAQTGSQAATDEPGASAQPEQSQQPAAPATTGAIAVANVERGRIAMIGGVVSLIWLIILVLMVWNS